MDKKSKSNKISMTAQEVGVLIEGLRNEFRVFGKKLSAVGNKVDIVYEELGRQREDIFIIKANITEIKNMLKAQDKRIVRLEEICTK